VRVFQPPVAWGEILQPTTALIRNARHSM
jgi:hypothetical protein